MQKGLPMNEAGMDFLQIHTEYRPRIERYIKRLVGDYEAEDLTQEVFVKINQALQNFRGEAQLSTWIYRIATNAALDRLRSPSYQREIQPERPDGSAGDEPEAEGKDAWSAEEIPSPELLLFFKQRQECYQEFIEKLPESYRVVVMLSELGELAAGQIADILGLSLDTAKIRLHRGRARLLQELKNHCNPEDWL